MSKGKFQTGLSGGSQQIETDPEQESKAEAKTQTLEQEVGKGRIIVEIPEPYRAFEKGKGLVEAPMNCRLWTRSNGSQWVVFPDGSKHDPKKVGFTAEAWSSADVLDTRPIDQIPAEERGEVEA